MDVTRTQPSVDTLVSSAVPMFDQLGERIRSGRSIVSVIGLGYVGLPLLRALSQAGFPAIGFDIDQQKIDALNSGKSYIRHIPDADIAELRGGLGVTFTSDVSALKDADVILISVPTPVTKHRVPDLQYVTGTFETVSRYLRPGQLVVLESTTYPGTTRQIAKPILDRTGLRSEYDYFLAYSPEREDPGNPRFDTRSIPKVIGGDGPLALELADMVYGRFVKQT